MILLLKLFRDSIVWFLALTEEIDSISDTEWRRVVETSVEEVCQKVSSPGAQDDTVEHTMATATNN